MKMSA